MQKVLVFGMGNMYREKEQYIKSHFEIVGYLDNEVLTNRKVNENGELPIYHPEKYDGYAQKDLYIILMSKQYVVMWEQLYRLGVHGEKIIFGIMFPPYTEKEEALFQDGGYLSIEGEDILYYYTAEKYAKINKKEDLDKIADELLREKYRQEYPLIDAIAKMSPRPASRIFGLERGKAIDRYYIENFLEKNRKYIHGDCLEIAENTYTVRYGQKVTNSYILHVEGWGDNAIKGNLATGDGIKEDKYDCAIITQTLMFIFDIHKAAQNIYKMLKKGGTALLTVSGISQISRYDADLWGDYYSFHEDSLRALFDPIFGTENVDLDVYGNVKTAMAFLYGLCYEDLQEKDFEVVDRDYPVILSVILKKI